MAINRIGRVEESITSIERLTDYDCLYWNEYKIDMINRYGSDNEVVTVNIDNLHGDALNALSIIEKMKLINIKK